MKATKLTLTIKKELIEAGKAYARRQGLSLSKLISKYLQSLMPPSRDHALEDFRQQLLRRGYKPTKFRTKDLRERHILEKYL